MTRLFSMAALLSLLIFCCSAGVCGITVFSHDLHRTFHRKGHIWEIGCRGGVLLIDNVPQREFEVERIAALNRESRRQWEAQHDALRGSMERAPFGPEYTAARIKLDAWEGSHGIRWAGGVAEVPATPAAEYHIDLIWIVLLALMLPLAWMSSRSQRMSRRARGRMVLVGRIGVIVLVILFVAVGAQSFRNPIAFYVFHRESSYLIWIARGKVSVGRPPESDPGKLAAISRTAAHFRNGDLIWTLFPEIRYPVSRVPAGRPLPRGPLISCEIRPDVDYAHLDESPDTSELIGSCLRALRDPDRYQVAHIVLTRYRFLSRSRGLNALIFANLRFSGPINELEVRLTPEEMGVTRQTIFTPQIAPEQRPKIELKWHRTYDRFTREYPLWPLPALLMALPARWLYLAYRLRRRRRENRCLNCGYSLIANTSGRCPECGAIALDATSRETGVSPRLRPDSIC